MNSRLLVNTLLLTLFAIAPASAEPDVLVVCPAELRAALRPWEQYRRGQGHDLEIVEPPATAGELRALVHQVAKGGALKCVVLVGDVSTVPPAYVSAKVNVRWGSEPTIATDQLYADVDRDGVPDVATGRIPVDTPDELAAFVRKVMRYERSADQGPRRRRLEVVAGIGGFGPVTDALIEAAGRSVFEQVVPANFEVEQVAVNPAKTCEQISSGCFAWIYLGHGLPWQLDEVETPRGRRPILSVSDVPHVRCGAASPLAVLVACYTGAIDARADCLGEELALAEEGPIAVIAATRVTMPYGNSVLGCELLRAGVANRAATLGDMWLRAQRNTLAAAAPDDSLRTSLDSLARGVSPPPVELDDERREHVMMYHLLGDPLTRLSYPINVAATQGDTARK